ncbi:hypothetical protein M3Y98_01129400 [Aphelenchoides besseyi]|nr:hypothetical protein M3Y98_01129400 [Aphelenchoides besseyi]KAI6210572.1 hypothetical protein M3Y96_00342400 [Aphelenchoides besseyi]
MLTRYVLQLLFVIIAVIAVYAVAEPSADVDDYYVFARPFNRLASYASAELEPFDYDSQLQKRANRNYASSLRFGKRASKSYSSQLRFG